MINTSFTALQIGEPFTLIKHNGQEFQAAFELLSDEAGQSIHPLLVMFVPSATEDEIKLFEKETVKTRIFKEGGKALFLFRFGETSYVLETSFDPTLYPSHMLQNFNDCSNLLTIVVVDPLDDNRIKYLRASTFPLAFREQFLHLVARAMDTVRFTDKYRHWITEIWKDYHSLQIWQLAKDTGSLGEY